MANWKTDKEFLNQMLLQKEALDNRITEIAKKWNLSTDSTGVILPLAGSLARDSVAGSDSARVFTPSVVDSTVVDSTGVRLPQDSVRILSTDSIGTILPDSVRTLVVGSVAPSASDSIKVLPQDSVRSVLPDSVKVATVTPPASAPSNEGDIRSQYETYKVKLGDTIWELARKWGVTINDIVRANNNINPHKIKLNLVINKPKPSTTSTVKDEKDARYTDNGKDPYEPKVNFYSWLLTNRPDLISYAARKAVAQNYGISNYTGNEYQNIKLYNILKDEASVLDEEEATLNASAEALAAELQRLAEAAKLNTVALPVSESQSADNEKVSVRERLAERRELRKLENQERELSRIDELIKKLEEKRNKLIKGLKASKNLFGGKLNYILYYKYY